MSKREKEREKCVSVSHKKINRKKPNKQKIIRIDL